MRPQDLLRDACCHLVNMIEDIDKAAMCSGGCYCEQSDVAFCPIPVALDTFWQLCLCIDEIMQAKFDILITELNLLTFAYW